MSNSSRTEIVLVVEKCILQRIISVSIAFAHYLMTEVLEYLRLIHWNGEDEEMVNSKKDVWWLNCQLETCPYSLVFPWVDGSIEYLQRALFDGDKYFLTEMFLHFENINAYGAYFKEHEMKRFIKAMVKLIKNNPEKADAVNKEAIVLNEAYLAFSKHVHRLKLEKLSDAELYDVYRQLMEIQTKSHMHALTTTWFVDSHDSDFSRFLMGEIEKKIKRSKAKITVAEAFRILTSLPKDSLTLKEEIDSLELLKEIKRDKAAFKALKECKDFSKMPKGINESLRQKMIAHCERWKWLPFTYIGPAYDVGDYMGFWKENIDADIDKALDIYYKRPKQVEEEREKTIKLLGLDDKEKLLFDVAAEIVFLKGYRKETYFHGSYVLSFIRKEIAKRKNVSINQLYLFTHDDVKELLVGDGIDIDKINIRQKDTILYYSIKDGFRIFDGDKAKGFLDNIVIKKECIEKDASELNGICACNGNAKGTVKIVNKVDEMNKMEKGDIMVSHTTFPSLVPAMKKAAAIITEDGGITCHAAIVSRELNTPCITGVKHAIEILNDGDIVEVDAGNGIVRRNKGDRG